MKKLTLEIIEKNKMSGIDAVKFFDPSLSTQQCDFILWEYTCFPFSLEKTIEQLNEYFNAN